MKGTPEGEQSIQIPKMIPDVDFLLQKGVIEGLVQNNRLPFFAGGMISEDPARFCLFIPPHGIKPDDTFQKTGNYVFNVDGELKASKALFVTSEQGIIIIERVSAELIRLIQENI